MIRLARLRDLVAEGQLEVNDGYRTRKSELGRPGIPILRVAEVQEGHLTPSFGDHVREEFRARIGSKLSQQGDVVVTTKGTVGRVSRIAATAPEFVYSPQVCFFRTTRKSTVDSRWLYYWLLGAEFRDQALGVQSQTDMADYINLADMRSLKISVPSLDEQRGIAATLGALDDKIDSNRHLSVLLSDFVIAEFAKLASSATGEQPLSELATAVKGVSYRRGDLQPSSTAMVSLKCFDRHGGFRPDGLKEFAGRYRPDQQLSPGELAIAQTDLTQGAEVVGRVVRVPPDSGYESLVASLDVLIVRPVDPTPPEFLYGVLLDDRFREHCRSRTSGTTVLHLSRDALPSYRAPRLGFLSQTQYAESVRPLIQRRERAEIESRRLADLRDTLLPELLSGRIRVPEAREAVESVG